MITLYHHLNYASAVTKGYAGRIIAHILIVSFLSITALHAFDNPHFYRATNFPGQPQLTKTMLSSLTVSAGGGTTKCGRNSCGVKTPILDIYGLYNMRELGVGVPGKDLSTPQDIALTMLALVPARDTFGMFAFCGKFNFAELYVAYQQNIRDGFFFSLYVPFRDIQITNVGYTDLSPQDDLYPNINTPQWQMFLNLFPAILTQYNLSLNGTCQKGVGDTVALLGWSQNYNATEDLDYIDLSLQTGILFPTGNVRNINQVFSLPLGYNGHYAIPLIFDISVGSFDWLTLGAHVDALFFVQKTECLRVKTTPNQSGMIKLAATNVKVSPGTIVDVSIYGKADHVCRGFSFIAGYTYSSKNQDSLNPCDCCVFNADIIANDQMYRSWNMHTINLIAEYDFAHDDCLFAPRVALFFNGIIGGKRIFNTNTGGGALGLDITWDF